MDETLSQVATPFTNFSAPIRRKYLAEAGLHLFSRGPAQFRPSDIYRFASVPQFREALEGSNIYIVCRRRRISVDPHSIRADGGVIHGALLLHGDHYHEWERCAFSFGPLPNTSGAPLEFLAAESADSFGHAVKVIDSENRLVYIPASALVARGKHGLGDRTRLEVMYVGQTYGREGNRISVDRLIRHSTLQRILADAADESGQDEILLLGLEYGNSKNILSTMGNRWIEPLASSDQELHHILDAPKQNFSRRDRILLAEAALINYFKPRYNIVHRESFNKRDRAKLKTLRTLTEKDFTALIVEVNTSNIGAKLWSKQAPRSALAEYFSPPEVEQMRKNMLTSDSNMTKQEFEEWVKDQTHAHIAKVALYDATERETFLHGLPWR